MLEDPHINQTEVIVALIKTVEMDGKLKQIPVVQEALDKLEPGQWAQLKQMTEELTWGNGGPIGDAANDDASDP